MKSGRMEALMALSGRTEVKEAISRRVKEFVESAPSPDGAGGSGANELAWCSVAANLVVTVQKLREDAFKGKDFTEEQYDQIMAASKQKDPNEVKEVREKRPEMKGMRAGSLTPCSQFDSNVEARIKLFAKEGGPRKLAMYRREEAMLAIRRMADVQEVRGQLIQQGCLKACIEGDEGWAVAKMLVTTDPRMLKDELRSGAAPVLLRSLDYKKGEVRREGVKGSCTAPPSLSLTPLVTSLYSLSSSRRS